MAKYEAESQNKRIRQIRQDMHRQNEWRKDLDRMKLAQVSSKLMCYAKVSRQCSVALVLSQQYAPC